MSGFLGALMSCAGGGVSLAQLAGPYVASRSTASSIISVNILTDGTMTVTGNIFTTLNFNWFTPTTTSIGSSYFVRMTETFISETGSLGGTTTGNIAATAIGATKTYSVISDVVADSPTYDVLIEIADSIGFSNIIASKTVRLTATRT
jgi:hypothetical protein